MTDRPEITAGSVCANRPEPSATELAALRQNLTGERRARLRSALAEVIAELIGDPDLDTVPATSTETASAGHAIPDQPDGIDDDSRDIPDARKAADRVLRYVAATGDGLYDYALAAGDGGPAPLYGRDLEALCRAIAEGTTTYCPAYLLKSVAQHGDHLHLECRECGDTVARIDPGDTLTDLLTSARAHHQSHHAHV